MIRELIANVWADGRGWGPGFGDTTPPPEVAELITDPAVWSEVDPVEVVQADPAQDPQPQSDVDTDGNAEAEADDAQADDTTPPAEIAEPTPTGGGWWELPDGTRVRGREAAEAAMAALEA